MPKFKFLLLLKIFFKLILDIINKNLEIFKIFQNNILNFNYVIKVKL